MLIDRCRLAAGGEAGDGAAAERAAAAERRRPRSPRRHRRRCRRQHAAAVGLRQQVPVRAPRRADAVHRFWYAQLNALVDRIDVYRPDSSI